MSGVERQYLDAQICALGNNFLAGDFVSAARWPSSIPRTALYHREQGQGSQHPGALMALALRWPRRVPRSLKCSAGVCGLQWAGRGEEPLAQAPVR